MKKMVIERDAYTCQDCGKSLAGAGANDFNVHHTKYEKIFGTEDINDLILLCIPCHTRRHRNEDSSK